MPVRYEHEQVEMVSLSELRPYDGNAKRHTNEQIDAVEASIREFGFRSPVLAWHDGDDPVIVAGHARCIAAKNLGMGEVPVIFVDDLSDAQRRALTLVDNQTTMMTGWDFDQLSYELDVLANDFDMSDFGFDSQEIDFSDLSSMSAESDESVEFEEKFKPKRTTDDCYTPPEVYEAIKDWACGEYGIDPSKVVRPFYQGGDYRSFDYSGGKVVVDNPPFSILSEILEFYVDRDVPFFLFCPALTGFSSKKTLMKTCHLMTGCTIVYENMAKVNTSFVTSFDDGIVAKTCPELRKIVEDKVNELEHIDKKENNKFEYPDEVVTAAIMARWSKYGIDFEVRREDCIPISKLDIQREDGSGIYGGGLLLSERAAAERAAAERAAAERAAREKAMISEDGTTIYRVLELSERERDLVASLGDVSHEA